MNAHPELDIARVLCDRIPELHADRFRAFGRKHIPERQDFVASLLLDAYMSRRKHRHTSGAIALGRDDIVRGLRVTNASTKYQEMLAPFFEFPEGNSGYSMQAKSTKPYTVKPDIRESLEAAMATDALLPLVWMREGQRCKPPPRAANGIPKPLSNHLFVPSTLSLRVDQVDRAVQSVEQRITLEGSSRPLDASKPNGTPLSAALAHLRIIRHWVRATGGLPNRYREQPQGRLGPLSSGHIIHLPAALRRLLLEDSGWIDYDLISCHLSVFVSLGRALGFETEHTEAYISDKNGQHQRWAAATGHETPNDFKSVVVSFLNGGTLSTSKHTASGRLLGGETMRTLMNRPDAQALQREISEGVKRIIAGATRERTTTAHSLVNAAGSVLQRDCTTSTGRQAAHLLTGYEQFAIRAMLTDETEVRAIVYDGFIAPPLDLQVLEDRVTRAAMSQLGFPLELRLRAEPFTNTITEGLKS